MTQERKRALEACGISVDDALERFMGNEALLERMLLRFPEDPSYGELVQAMERDDREGAFRAAHTLKGVCGNLSMGRLYRLVSDQVELLRGGSWDAARAMMPSVTQVYEAVCAAAAGR